MVQSNDKSWHVSVDELLIEMLQVMIVATALLALASGVHYESEWTSPDEYFRIKEHCMLKRNLTNPRRSLLRDDAVPIPPQIKISNVTITTCPRTGPLKVDLKVLGETLLPGYANFAFNVTSELEIVDDIVVDVEVSKIILGDHVRIPCMYNIGSCTYAKQCNSLKASTCQPEFVTQKIPCSCPQPKGRFASESFKIFVELTGMVDIPPWLADGHYSAEINIRTGRQHLTCLNTHMDIHKLKL